MSRQRKAAAGKEWGHSPHLPHEGLTGYPLTGTGLVVARAAIENRKGMFIAGGLPINYLSCQKCAPSPCSCQPCHQAEMTGEQTAGEELGKARSSARAQSSPPSDLGHYLLGTASADMDARGGVCVGWGGEVRGPVWAGAVSPRPRMGERERDPGLGSEGRRNTLYLHRMRLLSLLLWVLHL